ncbi:MAG: MarR family winged helix-turn-helix transcriptional regulator [Candidatus Coproplasma sp.]
MPTFLRNLSLVSHSATLFRDQKLKDVGVTGYQAKYLLAVCRENGISQDRLAKNLFVNKSNVARQIAALEELGFVRREQSADDKRVYLVYPTQKALDLCPEIHRINAEWYDVICQGFTDAENEQLAHLMAKLVSNARAYMESYNEKDS